MITNITPVSANPYDTYTANELNRSGLRLGQKITAEAGDFILSELSGSDDLVIGNILVEASRYSQNSLTITYTAKSGRTEAKLAISDAKTAVSADALAGKLLHLDDDSNQNLVARVHRNSAGTNGGSMDIHLMDDLSASPGANPNVDVLDPNYVARSEAGGSILLRVIGVAPVAVDQSANPYFWRQITGICPVLVGSTPAANRRLTAGDGTAGTAAEHATQAADDVLGFATVLLPAKANDQLCIAELDYLG